MGGSHGGRSGGSAVDSLHGAVASPVARMDARAKLVALVAFVFAVVCTPPEAVWAFGVYALVVAVAARCAALPLRTLARRMLFETPFVLFAVLLPFVGSGPRTEVLGISVSIAGSWAAWGILAKASLGVACSVVLAWSTPVADLLGALERLRCPKVLVAIAGFMVRYLDVVTGELHRLQVARVSRGDDPRWFWQGRAVAATAGTMFVRSFERGERIQQAMLARGFTGTFPTTAVTRSAGGWSAAAVPVAIALVVSVAANLWW
jgi:cobalt/nickel transport system permease protein